MPVSENRLYESNKLNMWFAISSILMTASLLWLIKVDHVRPWRDFQTEYYKGKAVLAHLDYLDANRKDRLDELALARQRLHDAEEFANQTSGTERIRLASDLAKAALEFKKADDPWSRVSQVLEVTRDTYERTLGKYGLESRLTEQAHKQLRAEEADEEKAIA